MNAIARRRFVGVFADYQIVEIFMEYSDEIWRLMDCLTDKKFKREMEVDVKHFWFGTLSQAERELLDDYKLDVFGGVYVSDELPCGCVVAAFSVIKDREKALRYALFRLRKKIRQHSC